MRELEDQIAAVEQHIIDVDSENLRELGAIEVVQGNDCHMCCFAPTNTKAA